MSQEPRVLAPVTPPQRLRRLPSWLVNQLAIRSTRVTAGGLQRPGARSDFAVLAALEEFGPMSQAELGRRLGLDRSDVVAVLNRLEGDRLAARAPDASDRRRNVITLTPAGARTLKGLQVSFDQMQTAMLAPLTGTERAHLTEMLQRLVDHHAAPASAAARTPNRVAAPRNRAKN